MDLEHYLNTLSPDEQYEAAKRFAANVGYVLIAEDDLKIRYSISYEPFHRIVSGQALTNSQLIAGGLFALIWFLMDAFWFISTFMHWFGL